MPIQCIHGPHAIELAEALGLTLHPSGFGPALAYVEVDASHTTLEHYLAHIGDRDAAIAAENIVLSTESWALPSFALAVRDGEVEEPSPAYWVWLIANTKPAAVAHGDARR